MPEEPIGDLPVIISGDYSDLKQAIDDAANEAQAGAERIAGAFEALVGIGEALAITESLKEFGQEALTAYGTVQSVTIGLTQLTKSAGDANDIIEQVKTLAATEPFAFPEIAPTVQKMVALGVSAEQIPAVMQAAADAAAATGNSFQQVANSIDRMSLSGTVSARSLVQLGISTKDLGEAMGVSADQVKAAFLAMDQEDRINAITTALEKFAGSAKAQAEGIAGQWQIFQNQFEEVMVGVGEALTPAVSAILSFGKETLGVIQDVVGVFNELPGPVKEAIGVFAIAVAAVAPLAAGVGALGLGLIGMKAAVADATTLLQKLGIVSTETAAAQSAQAKAATEVAAAEKEAAISTAAAGESANTAVFGFAAMDKAVGAASLALGALVGWDIGEWATKNVPGVDAFGKAMADLYTHTIDAIAGQKGFTDAFVLWITGLAAKGVQGNADYTNSIFLLSQKLGELGIIIPRGTMSMEEWRLKLVEAAVSQEKVMDGATGLGGGLDTLRTKTEKLNEAEQQTAADLLNAEQRYKDHEITLQELTAAQDAHTKAVDALNKLNPTFADSLGGVTEAYGKQQAVISTLQATVLTLLSQQDGSQSKAALLAEAEDKLAKAYDAHNKAVQQATDTTRAFVGPLTEAEEAANQAAGAMTSYETAAESLVQKQRDFNLSVQTAKGVLDALTASTDTSREHTAATIVGLEQYQAALRNAGQDINTLQTITINGVLYTGKLADIIKQAKDNMADFHTTTVAVPEVLDKAQQAALGLLTGMDSLQTGTKANIDVITTKAIPAYQTLYDQISKTPGAFTDLTSKYFDVNQATAAMVNTQDKLNTEFTNAQATVESLQKKLEAGNLTTQQSGDISRALAAALQTLINVEHQLGTSSGVSTTAIQAQQTQLTGLSSAASSTGLSMDNADRSMQAFTSGLDEKLGSVNAMTLGLWAMSAQLSGLTVFAGSGVDFSKGQMSAIDELSVLQQAEGARLGAPAAAAAAAQAAKTQGLVQQLIDAGVAWGDATNVLISLEDKATASHMSLSKVMSDYISTLGSTSKATSTLADATSGNATALGTKTTATTTATAATNSLATATTSLGTAAAAAVNALNSSSVTTTDALGNVTTAYTNATAGSQTFVDALGNVYSSYQALVAAIQANPLLAGAAQSTSGSGNPGSGPSTAPGQQFTDALGNVYSSYAALQAAILKNPLLAGAAQSSSNAMPQTLFSDPTGRFGNITSSGGQTLGSVLAALFPGGGSGGFSVGPGAIPSVGSPGFGQGVGISGQPLSLVMNYPSFNSQQQAQQVMNQMVAFLRTVPGLKL